MTDSEQNQSNFIYYHPFNQQFNFLFFSINTVKAHPHRLGQFLQKARRRKENSINFDFY